MPHPHPHPHLSPQPPAQPRPSPKPLFQLPNPSPAQPASLSLPSLDSPYQTPPRLHPAALRSWGSEAAAERVGTRHLGVAGTTHPRYRLLTLPSRYTFPHYLILPSSSTVKPQDPPPPPLLSPPHTPTPANNNNSRHFYDNHNSTTPLPKLTLRRPSFSRSLSHNRPTPQSSLLLVRRHFPSLLVSCLASHRRASHRRTSPTSSRQSARKLPASLN